MSDKDYGAHKLGLADKRMPCHSGIVFATNEGWCVANKEMHNDTEVVVENRGLLDRLKDAGFDKFGVALEGNPFGDLPRPRYVAECIAKHCGTVVEPPVVKDPEPTTCVGEGEDNKSPTVDDEPADNSGDDVKEPTNDDQVEDDETVNEQKADEADEPASKEPDIEAVEGEVKKYTKDQLLGMGMNELRVVGKEFGVSDISKEKLADKILDAQG